VTPTTTVTDAYLDACARDPALRGAVDAATLPPVFAESYRHILLPRPMFVADRRVRRFADDLAEVFRLLVSLPDRLFGGDLERHCAAVGIRPELAALMTRGDVANPPLFGRSDAYDDGTGLKLLEFNVGTELGGIDFAELNRALLAVPAFAEFAAAHGLEYVDTADVVAEVLREQARRVTDAERPVVVLLETTGGIAAHPNFRSVREAMTARGLDFRLGEVQDLSLERGKLVLDGVPVDVAMRFYAAGEILECPRGPDVLAPVFAAHEAGGTVLFTELTSSLHNTKGGLALLSDERHRDAFTPAERAVVDRVVPWTRVLTADADGLLDHCRRHRADLLLKPSVGWGAAGTVRGADVDDAGWRRLLAARCDGGYVVQRVVHPVPEPVWDPEEPEPEAWTANWGVFVTPAGYAGTFVRTLRPEDGRIVTFGNKGTRGACVFAVPSGAGEEAA
jgi:hypothetical protein